jgi:hypothetical protein
MIQNNEASRAAIDALLKHFPGVKLYYADGMFVFRAEEVDALEVYLHCAKTNTSCCIQFYPETPLPTVVRHIAEAAEALLKEANADAGQPG